MSSVDDESQCSHLLTLLQLRWEKQFGQEFVLETTIVLMKPYPTRNALLPIPLSIFVRETDSWSFPEFLEKKLKHKERELNIHPFISLSTKIYAYTSLSLLHFV